MNELVKSLMEKANLEEMAAQKAFDVVKGFLGDKLPSPIKDQVEKVLEGGNLEGGVAEGAMDAVKNLF